jgi:predicted kinase
MSGEELFKTLKQMNERGISPRDRERRLRRLSQQTGLTSDALRAKARRWARANGLAYPLMRARAEAEAVQARAEARRARAEWRANRVKTGRAALERGASWHEIASLWDLRTVEAAQQWWRRNEEGVKTRARPGRKRRR